MENNNLNEQPVVNEPKPSAEQPKKNGSKIAVIIACTVGGGFLLLMILPLLFSLFVYKSVRNNVVKQTRKIETAIDKNECTHFKSLTKYEKDNEQLYDKCMNSNEEFNGFYEEGLFDVIYSLGDASVGFSGITNKEDDDLVSFGESYTMEMSEHDTILWSYLSAAGTCFDKQVLKDLYKQLYSSDTKILYDYMENYDYNTVITDHMICFTSPDWGTSEGSELVSDTETGSERTIKYRIFAGPGDTLAYYTLNFKLEDGYWKIASENVVEVES